MRIAKYFSDTKITQTPEITQTLEECRDVLTVENLAALFGKNKDTIRRWCKTGALPAKPIGKQYYMLKQDFIRMFQE